jgi:hypothetical protein
MATENLVVLEYEIVKHRIVVFAVSVDSSTCLDETGEAASFSKTGSEGEVHTGFHTGRRYECPIGVGLIVESLMDAREHVCAIFWSECCRKMLGGSATASAGYGVCDGRG